MACLPTYKGKRYNSLQEIKDVIFKEISLKNKQILYYKDLGEPSHATALDFLINKYDWDQKEETEENGCASPF